MQSVSQDNLTSYVIFDPASERRLRATHISHSTVWRVVSEPGALHFANFEFDVAEYDVDALIELLKTVQAHRRGKP